MISVIIPVYNHAGKIGQTFKALLAQTYSDWELIVVNDGSDDDIDRVIEEWRGRFPHGRFHYFPRPHEGGNATRNFGATQAIGDYLLFCDADLTLRPHMLEKMLATLQEHPEASFAYSSFKYAGKIFRLFPYDPDRLRRMSYIHTSSLIRREHFPGFDPEIRRLQDWDLWLTMLNNGHTGVWIDEPLYSSERDGHISSWLPSAAYKLLPFLPAVKKYKAAHAVIKKKHGLA